MYLVASVHPFVRLCVLSCLNRLTYDLTSLKCCLCVCDQLAHADNCADAVDWLLFNFILGAPCKKI